MTDSAGICRLIDGDVLGWHGLPRSKDLKRTDLPDCFGPVIATSRRGFAMGVYNVQRHERGRGTRVDVYAWWGDDHVTFLDVWTAARPFPVTTFAFLPPPELTYLYEAQERETWEMEAPADAFVEEIVWGSLGLSAVIVRADVDAVVRLRGFVPMPSDVWIDGYVKFAAIPEM